MADVGIRLTAIDATKAAFTSVNQSLDGLKTAASGVQGALAGIGVGLTAGAFIGWIQSTIEAADAMNDMSQRVGISVAELAKYELAAKQSGTSMEAVAKGIKGLSGTMMEHGEALKKLGITATTADGAMRQFADIFAKMPDGMQKTNLAVEVFKKTGMDLIPMLNLGSEGLRVAAEKSAAYAAQMVLMAPLADEFNDSLATLGMNSKLLGMTMLNDALPGLISVSAAMAEAAKDSGLLQAAWVGLGGIGWEAIFKPAKVIWLGFNNTINEANASLMRFFGQTKAAADLQTMIARNNKEILSLTEENDKAPSPSKTNTSSTWLKDYKALMAAMGGGAGTTAKTVSEATKGLELYNGLMAQAAGFEKTWAADANKLRAALDGKTISQDQFNESVNALLAKQPLMVAAAKAEDDLRKSITESAQAKANLRNKENDDIEKYMAEQRLASLQDANAAEASVRVAQAEFDNQGKLKSVIEDTTVARMQDQLVNLTAGTEAYDNLQRQIDARKQLAGIYRSGEARDALAELADANKKAAEESGKYWEDAFMRAFESGKGFFQSLWDTIKNTLKTQVLKVLVSATGLTGMTTAASAASALTGGSGGLGGLSNLSSLSNMFPGASAALSTVSTAAIASMQSIVGITGTAAQAATAAANGLAYGATGSASMLTTIGSAMPYVAAAVLAYTLLTGNKTKSTEGTGQATQTFDATGRLTGTVAKDEWGGLSPRAAQAITGMQTAYTAQAMALGIKVAASSFTFGSNTGKQGEGNNFAVGGGVGSSSYSSGGEIAYTDAAMQLEASRAVYAALKGSELPKFLQGAFDGLAATGATQAQIDTTLTAATALASFNQQLVLLPGALGALADLSYAATQGLIAASGGLEALQTNLTAYYTNFYSAAEQTAQAIKNINAATAGSGLDAATATKESFRALVESQDLTTTSGQATYAALISVAGAFAALNPVVETVVDTVAVAVRSLADIASERTRLQDEYDTLTMTSTQMLEKQRAAIDASNVGLFDQVEALKAQAAALQAQAAALQATKDKLTSIADSVRAFALDVTNALATIADLNLTAQIDAANAANATAEKFGNLTKSLKDFVNGETLQPSVLFGDLLTKALGGNAEAMQALPGAASTAIGASRDSASTGAEFALQQARILVDVFKAASVADTLSTLTVAVPQGEDPMVKAVGDLQAALVPLLQGVKDGITLDLTSALGTIDTNLSGAIDQSEFIKYFNGQAPDSILAKIFNEFDSDSSGLISKLEATRLNTLETAQKISATATGAVSGATAKANAAANDVMGLADLKAAAQGQASATGIPAAYITDAFVKALLDKYDTNKTGGWSTSEITAGGRQGVIDAVAALQTNSQVAVLNTAVVLNPADSALLNAAKVLYLSSTTGVASAIFNAAAARVGGDIYSAVGWDGSPYNLRAKYGFATGGAFTNGIVSRPTDFNIAQMGEHGSEAIMPLANINGSLGVRFAGASANDDIVTELRALRSEVTNLRAEARSTAVSSNKTAKILERVTPDGVSLQTVAA
jgi:hypothetical protein